MNIIAEISSNHNQNLDRVFRLIDLAVKYNFHSVKFQLFDIYRLFASEILKNSHKHLKREDWQLPIDFVQPIYKYSKERNILVGYSPFYLDAVEIVKEFTDYYKIASYELLWKELIIKVLDTNKPIMISTGMATLQELVEGINFIPRDYPITVFHCSSAYPTKPMNVNLASIESIKNILLDMKFNNFDLGWSDHTRLTSVVSRAFHKYDVSYAEIHVDLDDQKGFEADAGHCWVESEIKTLCHSTQYGKICDGKRIKTYNTEEESDRLWRRDPQDGLRPYTSIRKTFKG